MSTKLLDPKLAGRQFVDRYEIMGEIASGGMATVFLSRITGVGGFQRLFAVKRLHPHLQGEKEFVDMFLGEARLAAGIHHPNVVPILEVGASPNGGYYLVMEFIEGETFARLLAKAAAAKKRIPEAVVIRVCLDMLVGLHAAHELRDESGGLAGVVHRDVSPQNLLVGVDGVARITDFGVARAASRLNATRAGQLKGKIAYMAPEQATGSDDVDRRADVFAAGVVLWEGLAHRRLFKAETEAATLARVIAEEIPRLHDVAPRVPKPIADVVMKALERNLSRRYATCAEFADALEKAALVSGRLGSVRDLQTYMQEVLGAEVQEQRNALRAWAVTAEAIPAPPPSSSQMTPTFGRTMSAISTEATATGSAVLPGPPPPRPLWPRLAAGVLALGIAAFAFSYWSETRRTQPAPAGAAAPALPPVSPPVPVAPAPAPVVEPKAPEPVPEVAPAAPTPTRKVVREPRSQDTAAPVQPRKKGSKTDPLLNSNPYR